MPERNDPRRLARADRGRGERFAVIDRMRAGFRDVPVAEIGRMTARAVAEVRAEMTAEQDSWGNGKRFGRSMRRRANGLASDGG